MRGPHGSPVFVASRLFDGQSDHETVEDALVAMVLAAGATVAKHLDPCWAQLLGYVDLQHILCEQLGGREQFLRDRG